jgi:hypothetical protein
MAAMKIIERRPALDAAMSISLHFRHHRRASDAERLTKTKQLNA